MAETQGYTSKMATAEGLRPSLTAGESSTALASQWRVLTRATTFVALLTSPAAYFWFDRQQGWAWYWSALAALGFVIAFRGLSGLALRHRPRCLHSPEPSGAPADRHLGPVPRDHGRRQLGPSGSLARA